jgi:hypothetical protein
MKELKTIPCPEIRTVMSKRNKANVRKGKTFERQIAIKFRELYPDSRRGYQFRDGSDAPDVVVGEWWIECKRSKVQTNPKAALAQAIKASEGSGKKPIAVTKDDRSDILVTLRLDDFLPLLEEMIDD